MNESDGLPTIGLARPEIFADHQLLFAFLEPGREFQIIDKP